MISLRNQSSQNRRLQRIRNNPMQEQLQEIRRKCVEANDDIMKLHFGCELLFEVEPQFTKGLYCISRKTGHYIVNEDNIEATILGEYIILGRKLGIADILLAIGSSLKINGLGGFSWFIDNEWQDIALPRWNLLEDDITKQSEEALDFIYNLLQ